MSVKVCLFAMLCASLQSGYGQRAPENSRIDLIFDTDANNELDDQHALAYLLFNSQTFNVIGVTVNATSGGGAIGRHYDEAYRVLQLCGAEHRIPLLKGADGDFASILPTIGADVYDGREAVDFLINKARQATAAEKLTVVAVGKLTNIALALEKSPETATTIKVIWLGGNYPEEGEYNLRADTIALNSIIKSAVEFEMVAVRYGMDSGADAVRVAQSTIQSTMPGKGPVIPFDVIGRHGGRFRNFGDYSVSLFEHIRYRDKARTRALFDVVPLAVIKNPTWGKRRLIPRILYAAGRWHGRAYPKGHITLWEHFDNEAIVQDFLSCFHDTKALSYGSPRDSVHSVRQTIDDFLIDGWCFEGPDSPLMNSACPPPNTQRAMQKKGEVFFVDGLAGLCPGKERRGILHAQSDVINQQEFTIWIRFKLSRDSLASLRNRSPRSAFFIIGGIKFFYLFDSGLGNQPAYGLQACIEKEGYSNEISLPMKAAIGMDTWVQLALTKDSQEGRISYRFYYRLEDPTKTLVNWIYLGRLQGSTTDNDDRLGIGNLSVENPLTHKILVDELRCYQKCLTTRELLDIWPGLAGFMDYPKSPYGTIIDYSPAKTGRYIAGSPSIVKLADRTYLAKGDDYGPAVGASELARIYRSVDNGETWQEISEVEGITWATLFHHRGAVYLLGTSAGHGLGHVVIMKSTDGGVNWTRPTDSRNGLLRSDLSYHTAPVPVVTYNGRLWRALEDEKGVGGWGKNFRAMVMSASIDSDLLDAGNWTFSEPIGYDSTWLGGLFNGILEGNAAIAPNGEIVNVLRVSMTKGGGKAAYVSYGREGKKPTFDSQTDFIDFPGGSTKFHILHDSLSNSYFALSNAVLGKHRNAEKGESLIRNTLVLMNSEDLRNWEVIDTVLYHPDVAKHGFQYPSFIFDGEDIVFVSRTAYEDGIGGAYRQHDVNYFTFHRIKDFRKRLAEHRSRSQERLSAQFGFW